MDPSLRDSPSASGDPFTTFEHELAGLAAKLQRWSLRVQEEEVDGSRPDGEGIEPATRLDISTGARPDGC